MNDPHTNDILTMARAEIATTGWMVTGVLADPAAATPSFQYTVGLWPKVGFELMILGLPPGTGQAILNDLTPRVLRGTRFTPHQRLSHVVAGYDVTMVEVHDTRGWLNLAHRLYHGRRPAPAIPAWQIVYPDRCLRMPWDSDYSGPPQVLSLPATPGTT
jgi:hypothetical protein